MERKAKNKSNKLIILIVVILLIIVASVLFVVWQSENRILASKLEYQIKTLTKQQKEELIIKNNLEELLGEKINVHEYKRKMTKVTEI